MTMRAIALTALLVLASPSAQAGSTRLPVLSAERMSALRADAEKGQAAAMVMLGIYERARDPAAARRWFEKAAAAGDANAMTLVGLQYQAQHQDREAAAWFAKAASRHDATAMLALAHLYADGRGVPKDESRAFDWTRRAADTGNALAIGEVADLYRDGRGTKANPVAAARWYRKAADTGSARAMFELALAYSGGAGVPHDEREAFAWSLKAAGAGLPVAMYQTGAHYKLGLGVAANPQEARRWFEAGAKNGDAEAMYGVAMFYRNGASADAERAADWMMRALRADSFQATQSMMMGAEKWSPAFRKILQAKLRQAGVYRGPISGRFDAATRKAIADLSQSAPKQ